MDAAGRAEDPQPSAALINDHAAERRSGSLAVRDGPSSGLQLFRPEALAHRQSSSIGTVVLAPRRANRLFTLTALLALAGIVALLWLAEFTRTARVGGWLVPQEGVVRVLAPRPGIVSALAVVEGQRVRKGEPLLTITDEVQSASVGATQSEIARRLEERRVSLFGDQTEQRRLMAQQQAALGRRIAALDGEQVQMLREIDLLRQRHSIAERTESLHRQQYEQGFISELRLQNVEADTLEQAARLAALERSRLANQRERIGLHAELDDLPVKFRRDIAAIDRSVAELEQERAEAEARREIVIPAPQDGTVTAIQAVPGAGIDLNVPLLAILPSNARLEAHLYAPSRAVGFVRPGQQVLLRHQAFAFQHFGHQEGEVESVSRSAIGPAELPRQLAGLPSLTGAAVGGAAEPVYRVTVSLANQSVQAGADRLALQSGMLLEADIALERRRLYEWLIEPLVSSVRPWRP